MARKPLVADGVCYTGNAVDWVPSEDTPGHVRARQILYTLTVNGAQAGSYDVGLTEDEMLDTVAGWIKSLHDKRRQEKRSADRRP